MARKGGTFSIVVINLHFYNIKYETETNDNIFSRNMKLVCGRGQGGGVVKYQNNQLVTSQSPRVSAVCQYARLG